jgi:hypothetical protein
MGRIAFVIRSARGGRLWEVARSSRTSTRHVCVGKLVGVWRLLEGVLMFWRTSRTVGGDRSHCGIAAIVIELCTQMGFIDFIPAARTSIGRNSTRKRVGELVSGRRVFHSGILLHSSVVGSQRRIFVSIGLFNGRLLHSGVSGRFFLQMNIAEIYPRSRMWISSRGNCWSRVNPSIKLTSDRQGSSNTSRVFKHLVPGMQK